MDDSQKKILIWVGAFVEDENGKFLFLKRGKNSSWGADQWQLPGGKMEWGEKPIETLKREFKEELKNDSLYEIEFIDINIAKIEAKGNIYHALELIYRGKISGKIELGEDHTSFIWMDPKQALNDNLTSDIKEFIKNNRQLSKYHL